MWVYQCSFRYSYWIVRCHTLLEFWNISTLVSFIGFKLMLTKFYIWYVSCFIVQIYNELWTFVTNGNFLLLSLWMIQLHEKYCLHFLIKSHWLISHPQEFLISKHIHFIIGKWAVFTLLNEFSPNGVWWTGIQLRHLPYDVFFNCNHNASVPQGIFVLNWSFYLLYVSPYLVSPPGPLSYCLHVSFFQRNPVVVFL